MVEKERSTMNTAVMNMTIQRVYNDTRERVYNDFVIILDLLDFSPKGPWIPDPL